MVGETTHFVNIVQKAGYSVEYVSPRGGYVPIDPSSFTVADEIDWQYYRDLDFRNRALSNSLTPTEVIENVGNYIAIYYTGGHGAMWDFPDNSSIQIISEKIYNAGGYITAVCHGVAGLLDIRDLLNEALIKNKRITGFSNEEEEINQTTNSVPFLLETELKKIGGKYIADVPWSVHVENDQRIITGQNPQSAEEVGIELLKELNNMKKNI